jgi:DNA replication regulator DPB11
VLNGTVRHDEKKLPKEVRAEAPENTEPAVLRKRKREAMDLVDDIISTTTVKVEIRQEPAGKEASSATVANAAGPLTIAKDAKPELALPDLVEETKPRRPEEESSRKPSMLHSSRATSFTKHEPSIPHPVPLHSATTPSLPPSIPHSAVVKVVKPEAGPSTSAFFAGLRFSHNIAEQCDGLEKALVTHGGTLVTEADRLEGAAVDFVVVRL